jgi:Ni/Co efflux regulator RcnB
MKSTAIVSAIAAAALGFSSLSFAQGYDRGDRGGRDDNRQGHSQRDNHANRDHRDDSRIGNGDARQAWQQRGQYQPQYQQQYSQRQYQVQQYQYQQPQYGRQGQWAGHAPRYQRGDSLPYQFRQRQYYVNDWRAHRGLYAPPYGYQWVQADGGDFLLVALATGLIANLLLNQY